MDMDTFCVKVGYYTDVYIIGIYLIKIINLYIIIYIIIKFNKLYLIKI